MKTQKNLLFLLGAVGSFSCFTIFFFAPILGTIMPNISHEILMHILFQFGILATAAFFMIPDNLFISEPEGIPLSLFISETLGIILALAGIFYWHQTNETMVRFFAIEFFLTMTIADIFGIYGLVYKKYLMRTT